MQHPEDAERTSREALPYEAPAIQERETLHGPLIGLVASPPPG